MLRKGGGMSVSNLFPIMIHADKSRVGKDHAAKKIVQVLAQHGIPACQFAIADDLKAFCESHFNVLPRYRYEQEPELRKAPIPDLDGIANVVDLWIKVGEFFRSLNKYFWITSCFGRILKASSGYNVYVPVISDYRFDCEYEFLIRLLQADHVTTLKINSAQGVQYASDGRVTYSADYEVFNLFDFSFGLQINAFCAHFIRNMEIKKHERGDS